MTLLVFVKGAPRLLETREPAPGQMVHLQKFSLLQFVLLVVNGKLLVKVEAIVLKQPIS